MALKLEFDCELFRCALKTDVSPSPDVLDSIMARWIQGIREAAEIAANTPVTVADDDD
jgi:hypothetical protein